ncbi:MAG: type II toxin-antitoxin system RelE/ParE family toxin [Candidatus Omnitrophota bacterium]
MYKLKIISQAQRDLDALHGEIFEKIKKKILSLSGNPRCVGIVKLTQEEGYRIKVADYRILYRIDDRLKEVIIYRVKHRREVYR